MIHASIGGAMGGAIKETRETTGIPYFLSGEAANNFLGITIGHNNKGHQFVADPRIPLSVDKNSGGGFSDK